MKALPILLPLLALTLAQDPVTDPTRCHCPDRFVARLDEEKGEYKCFGVRLKIVRPCGVVQRPRCRCTDATGVLTDHTGVWCSQYGGGREVKRWACENTKEWEEFFREHPDKRFQDITL